MLSLRTVIIISAFIKITILVVYNFITVDPSFLYFQNDGVLHDDEKYFSTILNYINNASGIWDWEQLKRSSLMNGHSLAGRDGLWFIIISVLGKLTSSTFSVQLLNILISTISLVYIYKLTEILFNLEVASLAIVFVGFNPFISIFSIFPFKDNFVQFLFLMIFYELVKGLKNNKFKVSSITLIAIAIATISELRSGLDYISLIMFLAFYLKTIKNTLLKIFVYISIAAFTAFILQNFIDKIDLAPRILEIIRVYILKDRMEGLGSLLRIDSLGKLFLLPLTMIFTFSSPFMTSLVKNISSWYDIAVLLNTLYFPLYVLGFFNLFEGMICRNNSNRIIDFIIFSIAALVSIISYGIFRHAYFFLPFILMYSASAIVKNTNVLNIIIFMAVYFFFLLIYIYRIF